MVIANSALDRAVLAAGAKAAIPESSLDLVQRRGRRLVHGPVKLFKVSSSSFHTSHWSSGPPPGVSASRCVAQAAFNDGERQFCVGPRTKKLRQHRSSCFVCNSLPPNLPDTTQENGANNDQPVGGVGAANLKGTAGSRSALSSLDSYLSKLEQEGSRVSGSDGASTAGSVSGESTKKLTKDQEALKKLDAYFDMLNPKIEEPESPPATPEPSRESVRASVQDLDPSFRSKSLDGSTPSTPTSSSDSSAYNNEVEDELDYLVEEYVRPTIREVLEEAKEEEKARAPFEKWQAIMEFQNPPVVVNMLVAINIAVYLLELATKNIGTGEFVMSLPNIYMSKVNGLIVGGEWWRIFTPMFLHDGFLHLLCGSWALLSLGPRVEGALGSLGFLAVYVLGGLFGNLLSFIVTPEPTVGGTGPVYAVVGAWVAFLIRNQSAIDEGVAQDAAAVPLVIAVINIVLPAGLPVDTWTHIGGALGGALLGAVTSPQLMRVPSDALRFKDERVEDEKEKQASPEVKEASSTGRIKDKYEDVEAELMELFSLTTKRVTKDDMPYSEGEERLVSDDQDLIPRVLRGSLCFGIFLVLFDMARNAGVDDLLYPTWSLL